MAKQTFTTGSVLTATQMNNLQANDYNWTVSQKTASYVLVAADAGTRIEMNAAGATTITVNTGLFAAGDNVYISNIGAGTTTITAGTATVNKSANASLGLSQYQAGVLYFVSASSAIFYPYDIGTAATTSGYTLLDSGSLTGSSVTTASLSQSYKELFVIIRGFRPSLDGSNIRMRINGDSTANRYYRGSGWSTSNNGVLFDNDNIQIVGNQDDTVGTGLGVFKIPDYSNTTTWKFIYNVMSLTVNQTTTTQINEYGGYGYYNQTGAITTLTFYPGSGGTFSAGSYFVYGI